MVAQTGELQSQAMVDVKRHSLVVRIAHWVNAAAFAFLVWSGVAILYAYPYFHWGDQGYLGLKPLLAVPLTMDKSYTTWARPMHFAFAWLFLANGLAYAIYTLLSGHWRKLTPKGSDLRPARLIDEARKHLARGRRESEASYNPLQRIAYVAVIGVLCPVIVLTGLTMAPVMVAQWPWLLDLFGGRQSARLIHFIAASLLVAFLVVHLWQVLAAGPVNQIRSMILGKYRMLVEAAE